MQARPANSRPRGPLPRAVLTRLPDRWTTRTLHSRWIALNEPTKPPLPGFRLLSDLINRLMATTPGNGYRLRTRKVFRLDVDGLKLLLPL